MNQATNGKWYVYIVDSSQSQLLDVDENGQEFGILCIAGISISESTTDLIVPAATGNLVGAWAALLETHTVGFSHSDATTSGGDGGCLNADGMVTTLDTPTSTARQDMTVVLANAPSLSNHDDTVNDGSATSGIDMGQRGHGLNESGYGSWPYILAIDLNDDNVVTYGGDAINVVYGNTDSETDISLTNRNPCDRA
jgi:hypothetical protein